MPVPASSITEASTPDSPARTAATSFGRTSFAAALIHRGIQTSSMAQAAPSSNLAWNAQVFVQQVLAASILWAANPASGGRKALLDFLSIFLDALRSLQVIVRKRLRATASTPHMGRAADSLAPGLDMLFICMDNTRYVSSVLLSTRQPQGVLPWNPKPRNRPSKSRPSRSRP
jgi:hypothetical protein